MRNGATVAYELQDGSGKEYSLLQEKKGKLKALYPKRMKIKTCLKRIVYIRN